MRSKHPAQTRPATAVSVHVEGALCANSRLPTAKGEEGARAVPRRHRCHLPPRGDLVLSVAWKRLSDSLSFMTGPSTPARPQGRAKGVWAMATQTGCPWRGRYLQLQGLGICAESRASQVVKRGASVREGQGHMCRPNPLTGPPAHEAGVVCERGRPCPHHAKAGAVVCRFDVQSSECSEGPAMPCVRFSERDLAEFRRCNKVG